MAPMNYVISYISKGENFWLDNNQEERFSMKDPIYVEAF